MVGPSVAVVGTSRATFTKYYKGFWRLTPATKKIEPKIADPAICGI